MPNKRAEGQKLLTLPASQDFIRTIDDNLASAGYANRSQFIRDAIIEKLERAGITLPKPLALPPTRVPEKPSSKVDAALGMAAQGIRDIIHKKRKSAVE